MPRDASKRSALRVALVCGVVSTALLYLNATRVDVGSLVDPGVPYAPAYRHPTNGLQALYDWHDGQAYAALAMDPSLSHADDWLGGAPEMAYRAVRPVVWGLAWVGSLGQPGLVQWSLAAETIIGVALLGFAAARLATRYGRDPNHTVAVLAVPGMLVVLMNPGLTDALGTALALLGMGCWLDGRRRCALVLFTLAVLTREMLFLVPLALILDDLWDHRSIRRVLALVVPAVVYLGWVAVVRWRVGALPTGVHGVMGWPFVGLVSVISKGWSSGGLVAALFVAILLVGGMVRRPPRVVALVIGLSALLAICSGHLVWQRWQDGFSRTLLPAEVLALVFLLPVSRSEEDRDRVAVRLAT